MTGRRVAALVGLGAVAYAVYLFRRMNAELERACALGGEYR